MSTLVTPQEQSRYLDPYHAKLFDFNNSDSRIYIARSINSLLNVQGNDVIINDMEIADLNYNSSNDIITCMITPGRCIIDQTLIEIRESIYLSLDVSPYDQNGKVVISLSYQFLETVYSNEAILKISYVTSSGSDVSPEPWYTQIDRIVLDVFEFNKTNKTVVSVVDRTPLAPEYTINIKGQNYIARQKDRSTKYNEDFLRQILI